MRWPSRRCGLGAVASLVGVLVVLVAGCGGDDAEPAPPYTAAQVERQIERSIQPTLAANLGEGSTMTVSCVTDEEYAYRCTTQLNPGGGAAGAVRVIYRVDCDASTCRWTPIG